MPSFTTGVLAWLLVALAAPAADTWWQEPSPGLHYRRVDLAPPGTSRRIGVHVFRFSLDGFELRVLPAPGDGGATVAELARGSGALVAVNGGFFTHAFAPLGLLVSEGRALSPLRHADWGVFYVARGEAGLVHRRHWRPLPGLEFAVESGPRLVADGRPLTFKPQSARRTALGILPDGRVLLVATDGPLLTSELAALFARPSSEGGLGCRYALNLDGGSSTQLWFGDESRGIAIPAVAPVANAVALFRR